jgi:hypothetical protein
VCVHVSRKEKLVKSVTKMLGITIQFVDVPYANAMPKDLPLSNVINLLESVTALQVRNNF